VEASELSVPFIFAYASTLDGLCGLVVRVSGYRSRGRRVRFPALPDVLISSGSGTGSTQPGEDN
jgi:hypothetical protein